MLGSTCGEGLLSLVIMLHWYLCSAGFQWWWTLEGISEKESWNQLGQECKTQSRDEAQAERWKESAPPSQNWWQFEIPEEIISAASGTQSGLES